MNIKSFLKLVEIQTKLASIVPFTLGTVYALYRFNKFNMENFFIMLISLLCIDMAATALNNYYDFKRAKKKHGYNYESHNAIVSYSLKIPTVLTAISIMLFIAFAAGIILVIKTDIIVLLLGIASFGTGILYSAGPVPISRTPLGEILSGFFMGFIILFLSVYIHTFDLEIASITCKNNFLDLKLNIMEILFIFLFSIPTMACIANIMLANNICDIDDDINNKRYTLPIYVGKKNALLIFKLLYYIAYADIILMALLKITPFISLFTIATLIPVNKNISLFFKTQKKESTFALSVKNFSLICLSFLFLTGIQVIFESLIF